MQGNTDQAAGSEQAMAGAALVEAATTVQALKERSATATEMVARIAEFANQVLAAKAQLAGDQAVIATKSDHIQKAQDHADAVRANLDRTLTAATQHVTEAEGLRTRAQTAADSASELQAAIAARKAAVDVAADAIAEAKEASDKTAAGLSQLLERANNAEQRVADYEMRLAGLEAQCKKQLEAITELLPGAASAGLSRAFDARRKTFLEPSRGWQWLFVGSVSLLVLLAGTGLLQAYSHTDTTYDSLWRLWIARLPVGAALVWLALHSAREAALAKRLEEDYGYKSAIAASFVGFNEQMTRIAEAAKPETPLAKLCSDTLATLASPPGRIYDKHALTTTPAKELKEMLEAALARKDKATS